MTREFSTASAVNVHAELHQRGVQLLRANRPRRSGRGRLAARARWREDCGSAAAARPSGAIQFEGRWPRGASAAAARRPACGAGADRRPRAWRASPRSRQRLLDRQQPARLHHPQQADLQMKPRLQRELQIAEQIERELQIARQILFAKSAPRCRASCCALARRTPRSGARRAPGDPRHQQVAEIARQFAAEMLQVVPVALQLVHHFEHARANRRPPAPASPAPATPARTRPAARALPRRRAWCRSRRWPGRAPKANRARCLRRPAPAPPALRRRPRCLPARRSTPCASIRSSKSTERKLKCWQRDAMVAGILCASVVQSMKTTHARRLFDGLQQRVEGLVGDLVRFVDDEDLVAVARRLVAHVLAQLAHFVDAAIGGRVDFDDVDRAAGGDFEATRADAAGRGRWVRLCSSGSAPECARWWSCRCRAGPKRCSRARCGSARWRFRSVVLTCS